MWIVPKNQPWSACAQDTADSNSDLGLLSEMCSSYLLWRSKPSPAPTWLRRWKRASWLRHLSGRILKQLPDGQQVVFDTRLTGYWRASRASRSAKQVEGQRMQTRGTCSLPSSMSSSRLSQWQSYSKTSRALSVPSSVVMSGQTQPEPPYCSMSSENWNAEVTRRRGMRQARMEQVRHMRESAYSSLLCEPMRWRTPDVAQAEKVSNKPNFGQLGLANDPALHGYTVEREPMQKSMGGDGQSTKPKERIVPLCSVAGQCQDSECHVEGCLLRGNGAGSHRGPLEIRRFATPRSRDAGDWCMNHARRGKKEEDTLVGQATDQKRLGSLNPRWEEALMGLKLGWLRPSATVESMR